MTETASETPEFVFTFTALDEAVAGEARELFGSANVSSSKRMTGGLLVDVFLKVAAEIFGKILDFKSRRGDRIQHAKVTIGKEEISLEGYSAEDVQRLLRSKGVQDALARVQGSAE